MIAIGTLVTVSGVLPSLATLRAARGGLLWSAVTLAGERGDARREAR